MKKHLRHQRHNRNLNDTIRNRLHEVINYFNLQEGMTFTDLEYYQINNRIVEINMKYK